MQEGPKAKLNPYFSVIVFGLGGAVYHTASDWRRTSIEPNLKPSHKHYRDCLDKCRKVCVTYENLG